ncbi:MAG: hypothetical protein R2939_10865 [Kofleriaceae bacterium]
MRAAAPSAPGPWRGGATGGGVVPSGPSAPTPPVASRVRVDDVPVGTGAVGIDNYLAGLVYVAAAPAGGVRLGWNDRNTAYLRTLDANLAPVGADLVLPGTVITALQATPDGGLLIAAITATDQHIANAFQTDLELSLVRLGPDGAQRFRTSLVGGRGTQPESIWHAWSPAHGVGLASTGTEHAVYITISKNFGGSSGTHQGDLFVVVGDDGRVKADRTETWSASHSNQLFVERTAAGEWLTVTVGDAYPIGVYVINRDRDARAVVWPPEELGVDRDDFNSTLGAGYLCGVVRVGDRFLATASTSRKGYTDFWKEQADVLAIGFDASGGAVTRRWLTETPSTTEVCPLLASQGGTVLTAWPASAPPDGSYREAPTQTTLAVLAPDGAIVDGPVVVDAPLSSHDVPATLTDGTVAWATADYRGSTIRLVRVRP